jgi:hypothetical protein
MSFFRIYLPVICLLFCFSCKKYVDDKKKEAAMSFITNGQWVVESYLINDLSITEQFTGYKFKFDENGTVTGDNGTTIQSGTWTPDITDYSITSQFPGAGAPLDKLNGHWIIKDSGTTFVKADLTRPGGVMHLHLVKVP